MLAACHSSSSEEKFVPFLAATEMGFFSRLLNFSPADRL
jgi:hypothetical protein